MSTDAPENDIPIYWGYISCFIAVILFGSNFVIVKRFETGDGMFFQWVCCASIWLTGLAIFLFRYPHGTFYPLAMVGGILWCTGNIMTVPIIKTIGLGQGILVWGSFNLLLGWASGRFGWFGLDAEIPHNTTLNYIGMTLCFASAFLYIFVRSEVHSRVTPPNETIYVDETQPIIGTINEFPGQEPEQTTAPKHHDPDDITILDTMNPMAKRIMGILMAVVAGCLYGLNFAPVIYIQNNYVDENGYKVSQNGLDYIFAHWCGVFAMSSFVLIVYCAYMLNNPRVYPQAILPGVVCGVMWAVADAAWFVANSVLSEPISFPIVTTGPGMIATIWGIFYGEIRGLRNYLILTLAFSVTIAGTVLTALSKVE